jgi:hypothetical protein
MTVTIFHIHLQHTVSLYYYDHAIPSFISSVISHIFRPVLSHHQGNNPHITRGLLAALHLYHTRVYKLLQLKVTVGAVCGKTYCPHQLLWCLKHAVTVGSEHYLDCLTQISNCVLNSMGALLHWLLQTSRNGSRVETNHMSWALCEVGVTSYPEASKRQKCA